MKENIDSPIYKRLQRESNKNKKYHPTKHAITRWFNIINREIFDNGLDPYESVKIGGVLARFWGTTQEVTDIDGNLTRVKLELQHRFPGFDVFLITLAHEMVHLFQAREHGMSNHGRTFYAWQDEFKKHGLPLDNKA